MQYTHLILEFHATGAARKHYATSYTEAVEFAEDLVAYHRDRKAVVEQLPTKP